MTLPGRTPTRRGNQRAGSSVTQPATSLPWCMTHRAQPALHNPRLPATDLSNSASATSTSARGIANSPPTTVTSLALVDVPWPNDRTPPPPVSAVAVAPRCRHGYIEERSERNLQGISNRRPADRAVRHGTGRPQRSDPDGRVVVLFLLPRRPGTPPAHQSRYAGHVIPHAARGTLQKSRTRSIRWGVAAATREAPLRRAASVAPLAARAQGEGNTPVSYTHLRA